MCPSIVAISALFSSLVGAQIPHQRSNDPSPTLLPAHTVGFNIAWHGMRACTVFRSYAWSDYDGDTKMLQLVISG